MPVMYRVIKSHVPDNTKPLTLKKGDSVTFERRETNWQGWLWCTKPNGDAGWVPESWTRIEGDHAILERDYDATELSVQPGTLLEAILHESGWLLAVSSDGTTGWIPLDCVEQRGVETT